MPTALSARLRSETKAAHTAAERSGVMRGLLRGAISQGTYVTLLVNLEVIYGALEEELERNALHPALAGVEWGSLRRLPALQQDIKRLSMPGDTHPVLDAARQYAARLHDLGTRSPDRLFAHAYLRYLGDLYGGQILKRIVHDTFGENQGYITAFYDFNDIADIAAFKIEFREAIDRIPPGVADADSMVQEAQYGYELHAQLFEEIQRVAEPEGGES